MNRKLTPYEIAQRQAERARYQAMLAHCETCPFATYTGSHTWFCPLPVCRYNMPKEVPHHDSDAAPQSKGLSRRRSAHRPTWKPIRVSNLIDHIGGER